MEVPEIPLPVVLWLEAVYRNEVPHASMPEWEKCEKAGEQNVVRNVRLQYNRQQEEDTDE